MTMPHLMNCPHSPDSWCLTCVKELWEEKYEKEELLEKIAKVSDLRGVQIRNLVKAIKELQAAHDSFNEFILTISHSSY